MIGHPDTPVWRFTGYLDEHEAFLGDKLIPVAYSDYDSIFLSYSGKLYAVWNELLSEYDGDDYYESLDTMCNLFCELTKTGLRLIYDTTGKSIVEPRVCPCPETLNNDSGSEINVEN